MSTSKCIMVTCMHENIFEYKYINISVYLQWSEDDNSISYTIIATLLKMGSCGNSKGVIFRPNYSFWSENNSFGVTTTICLSIFNSVHNYTKPKKPLPYAMHYLEPVQRCMQHSAQYLAISIGL